MGHFLHYKIDRKLGENAIGKSYLATDHNTNSKVLLRVMPAKVFSNLDAKRRFLQQAREIQKLDHPNIVQTTEVGEAKGKVYIASEYVRGVTLDLAAADRVFSTQDVSKAASDLVDALAAARQVGIIHGDITPKRILVTPDNRFKLRDFVLSEILAEPLRRRRTRWDKLKSLLRKFQGPAAKKREQLSERELMEAISYIAPEQLEGQVADAGSDLYSVGAVLHKLLTGRPPERQSPHSRTNPPVRESISDDRKLDNAADEYLGDVVDRLLSCEPGTRLKAADRILMTSLKNSADQTAIGGSRHPRSGETSPASNRTDHPTAGTLIPKGFQPPGRRQSKRHVNAWFESDDEVPPLKVGRWYQFKVNIGKRRRTDAGHSTNFVEPKWGHRQEQFLLISFFSEDFEIEGRHHELVLPRDRDSDAVETRLKALHEDACCLEIVISLSKELDILQTLRFEIAAEKSLPTEMGAADG